MRAPSVARRATSPTGSPSGSPYRRPSGLLSGLATGAVVGAGWGVLARVFMRLITTTPEFSWAGTLLIVGLSALLGGGIGLVAGARAAGRSRWWRLAPVPGLVLFASPGMVLLPGAVGVALAASVRRVWLRVLLSVAGLAVTFLPALSAEDGGPVTLTPTMSAGLALVVVATVLLGLGFHVWWRRWTPAAGGGGSPAAGPAEPATPRALA